MKRIVAITTALLLVVSYVSSADEQHKNEKPAQQQQVQKQVEKFNNPICPIMGRKVNGKNFGVYKGVRYELCCGGCQKAFPKNPEKYLKKLPNNGKIVELNNTICPVMGGKVNKKYSAIYNGTKVYFCCPGCIAKFNKDPETYLKKLSDKK